VTVEDDGDTRSGGAKARQLRGVGRKFEGELC